MENRLDWEVRGKIRLGFLYADQSFYCRDCNWWLEWVTKIFFCANPCVYSCYLYWLGNSEYGELHHWLCWTWTSSPGCSKASIRDRKIQLFLWQGMSEGISKHVTSSTTAGQFLEYFFAEDDAKFFASLGLNCIRIPVSSQYRSQNGHLQLSVHCR